MHTDNDLSALLDGELDSASAKKLREALANDVALAERLEHLAFVDSLVKTSYQAIDSEPLPQSIVNLMADDVIEESNIVPINRSAWSSRPMQFAAAVLISFGVVMGTSLLKQPLPDVYTQAVTVGLIDARSPLNSILNNSASAVPNQLSSGNANGESVVAITPVLSFKSAVGDWCREYTVKSYTAGARTLACARDNQWQIVLTSIEQSASAPNQYETASTVTSAAFDAHVDSLIVGEPLSADQESELIGSDWTKTQ